MKRLFATLLICAAAACAADISGNWKGTADAGGNAIERTFTFKQDGTKLTGETTSQMMGKSVINEGKVEGDNISFSINAKFQENEMKLTYKWKVTGNEIHLSSDFGGGGQTIEWTLKKQ